MSKWGKSKYLNALTAMALTASAVVVAPITSEASSFKDVQRTHPFYEEIKNLNDRGIIKGFKDGTFKPEQNLTRGQAAKIIAGVLELDTSNVSNPNFKDIPTNHLYFGAIAALRQEGIIDGYEDGTFRQHEFIQRNHVAKILANAFKLKASNTNSLPFTDVRVEYKDAIAALYENNVTTGKTATFFDGSSNVTRGQMAAFITRSEGIVNPPTQPSQSVTFKVEEYTANELAIHGKTYLFGDSVKSIFTAENKTALTGAKITATIENGTITKVNTIVLNQTDPEKKEVVFNTNATLDSITINADNMTVKNVTVTGNVIITSNVKTKIEFDGVTLAGDLIIANPSDEAMASLESEKQRTPVLKIKNSRAGKVQVKRNFSIVSDTTIPELIITGNISAISIDGAATKVIIESTAKLNMTGNVKFEQVLLPVAVKLLLNVDGVMNELTVLNADTRLTISSGLHINNLTIPAGSTVTNIITNFTSVASQIKAIIGGSSPSTGGSDTGGGNVTPDPVIPPEKGNEFHVKNAEELKQALNKAKVGDLIKLTAPVTADVTLTDLVVIDLNGHTLNGNVTLTAPTASGRYSLMPSGSTGTISGDLIIYAPNVTLSLDGLTVVGNTVIE
ncbi:S-layer homology domain-containing protein [Lysinibacillus capsici]|uniref:S-layer homology domain-containing protein n=1 Tax=Lysinibacillus capsici TaxID=2115968 RepID=UPI0029DE5E8D|nr:S-layer homology domain-containing protein [Lysinibacillus capsici]WPK03586.1 S-layer homology domain-containing protein [Lysinibacillus capsici]